MCPSCRARSSIGLICVLSLGALPSAWAQETPQPPPPPPPHRANAEYPRHPDPGPGGMNPAQPPRGEPVPRGRAHRAFSELSLEMVTLKHADAREVAAVLEHAVGGSAPLMVTVDARTNALILSTERGYDASSIMELISNLDEFVAADDGTCVEIALSHAGADAVADAVRNLHVPWRGQMLRVHADKRTNSLWLSGSARLVEQFARVSRDMDAPGPTQERAAALAPRTVQYHALAHADAMPLSQSLNVLFQSMNWDLKIIPATDANAALAYATQEQADQLRELIQRLDVPSRRDGKDRTPPSARSAAPLAGQPRPLSDGAASEPPR
jgi:type II secretory pathway component GspD/PulD (secretin)